MTRDEILERLVLEADHGLSPEEADRLREELRRNPSLERERQRIHRAFRALKVEFGSLRLPARFGEEALDRWLSRPEGVLAGAPLKIAAALFCCATLLHAMTGPATVGACTEPGAVADHPAPADPSWRELRVGDVAQAGSRIAFHGGTRIELGRGQLEVLSPTSVDLGSGPVLAEVVFGTRVSDVRLPELSLAGRRASITIRQDGATEPLEIEVHEGAVRLGSPSFTGVLQAGDRYTSGAGELPLTVPRNAVAPPEATRRELHPPARSVEASDEEVFWRDVKRAESSAVEEMLTGVVHGPAGEPVVGAQVQATPSLGVHSSELWIRMAVEGTWNAWRLARYEEDARARSFTTWTDETGSFSFAGFDSDSGSGLEDGLYRIQVLAPPGAPWADQDAGVLRLDAEQQSFLDVSLAAGRTLHGSVVDELDRPVSRARVRSDLRLVVTDAGGYFQLEGADVKAETLLVDADGFVPLVVDTRKTSPERLVLRAADPLRVTFSGSVGEVHTVTAFFLLEGHALERELVPDGQGQFLSSEVPEDVVVWLDIAGRAGPDGPAQVARWEPGENRLMQLSAPRICEEVLEVRAIDGSVIRSGWIDSEYAGGWWPQAIAEGTARVTCSAAFPGNPLLVTAPGYRAEVAGVSGRYDSMDGQVVLTAQRTRELSLVDIDGRALDPVYGVWIVEHLDAGRWVRVEPLGALEAGKLLVPDASINLSDPSSPFRLLLAVGAPGHRTLVEVDDGQWLSRRLTLKLPGLDQH